MPNFDEKDTTDNTVIPSKTYDVSTTCDDSTNLCKSTKPETTKDEIPLDKPAIDETRDENKKQEKNSLQREVSVDALSSKIFNNSKGTKIQ